MISIQLVSQTNMSNYNNNSSKNKKITIIKVTTIINTMINKRKYNCLIIKTSHTGQGNLHTNM